MEKFLSTMQQYLGLENIIIAVGAALIGALISWLITRRYTGTIMDAIGKLRKDRTPLRPLFEIMENIDKELSQKSLHRMFTEAALRDDKELLDKAFFLNSLSKIDSEKDSFLGFMELTNYSSDLFSKHLPHLLAKLIATDNPTAIGFLLSLLYDKLRTH